MISQVDTSGAAGAGPSQQHMTVQQQRDLMPEQEDSGDREASRWAYSESMGRADSARWDHQPVPKPVCQNNCHVSPLRAAALQALLLFLQGR